MGRKTPRLQKLIGHEAGILRRNYPGLSQKPVPGREPYPESAALLGMQFPISRDLPPRTGYETLGWHGKVALAGETPGGPETATFPSQDLAQPRHTSGRASCFRVPGSCDRPPPQSPWHRVPLGSTGQPANGRRACLGANVSPWHRAPHFFPCGK